MIRQDSKPRDDGDYSIYIRESYSVKNKKKKRTLFTFDSAKALGNDKEIDEAVKKKIAELLEEKKQKNIVKHLPIDLNKPLFDQSFDKVKNLGYLFLQKAWTDLKIYDFLRLYKSMNKLNINYSLNDTLRLMVFTRVISPSSKLKTFDYKNKYLEDFDVTLDSLYDTLTRIPDFQDKLTQKLSKECSEKINLNSEAVYYDCTNFYFEIQNADDSDGLRDYGVEKNHRPDPIVEYGLLYDERGFPIGSTVFRGNQSEKTSLQPLLLSAGEEITKAKIICADAGLNTTNNKKIIRETGRNYIFSQGIKGISNSKNKKLKDVESDYEWAINGKNMIEYGNANHSGKKCSYKERYIKRSNGLEERLIIKFDPDAQAFTLKNIEKRLERAKYFIDHPSRLNYDNCQDGKEYLSRVTFDKETGEVKETKVELNMDIVEKEKREAGYYGFVTDIPTKDSLTEEEIKEMKKNGYRYAPKTAIEILKISGKRVEIENCFRLMKTNMGARPIYVYLKDHIQGHLFTVYLALLLVTYIKVKYDIELTDDCLFDAISKFQCIENKSGDIYEVVYYNKDIQEIIKKLGLNYLDYEYFNNNTRREIITKSKK